MDYNIEIVKSILKSVKQSNGQRHLVGALYAYS